jgi:hypothetical protein
VNSGPFLKKIQTKDFINIKKKSFSCEVKDIRNLPPLFLLHKLHKPALPPCPVPRPPLRPYLGNVAKLADKLNGRNINVSFTNNSNVPIEVMVFIFYSDEITIDVKTGLVTRHKN